MAQIRNLLSWDLAKQFIPWLVSFLAKDQMYYSLHMYALWFLGSFSQPLLHLKQTYLHILHIFIHPYTSIHTYTSSQGKARQWRVTFSFLSLLVTLLFRDPALFEHIVAYLEGTAMALPEKGVCDHPLHLAGGGGICFSSVFIHNRSITN